MPLTLLEDDVPQPPATLARGTDPIPSLVPRAARPRLPRTNLWIEDLKSAANKPDEE